MTKLIDRQKKRKLRKLRAKIIKGTFQKPRLVFFKSNRYLGAQVIKTIDCQKEQKEHTLIYLSTNSLTGSNDNEFCRKNKEWAQKLGQAMARELKKQEIKQVVFDRNGYPYHGKIQAFCEPLHQMGILGVKR